MKITQINMFGDDDPVSSYNVEKIKKNTKRAVELLWTLDSDLKTVPNVTSNPDLMDYLDELLITAIRLRTCLNTEIGEPCSCI